MPVIVKSKLRHTKEMYGARIPGDGTIFALDDAALFERLIRDGVIEMWEIPIVQSARHLLPMQSGQSDVMEENKPLDLDIWVVSRWVKDGIGGGEPSIREMVCDLREAGYSTLWNTVEDFKFLIQRGGIKPKIVMVRSDTPPFVIDFARGMYPDVHGIMTAHSTMHPDCFGEYECYICNSEFTERWARSLGAKETVVQYPMLTPGSARCEKVIPSYVLSTNMYAGKGGAIVSELAARMPDVQFVGIHFDQVRPEIHGNLTILPWNWDMRPVYAGAAVVIQNTVIPESYGKVCIEAVGNGTPSIVSDSAFLSEQAARFPNLIECIPANSPITAWQDAIRRALAKGLQPRHEEVWQVNHKPIIEWLGKHGFPPSHSRLPLRMIRLGGHYVGVGDAIMLYPTLKELSKYFALYYDPNSYANPAMGKAILENCQYLEKGMAPLNAIPFNLEPVDKNERQAQYSTEPRHLSYARRAYVRVKDWHPDLFTLPENGKKNIGVCLWANCTQRTMPAAFAARLIDRLKMQYNVILLDRVQHPEYKDILDLGGKFSISFLPLIVRKFDAVVSVDTGIAHIAGARHVPFVVLLGAVAPGVAASYEMYDCPKRQLFLGLDCSPCWLSANRKVNAAGLYGCDGEPECLKFEPEQILKAVGELLG